MVCKIWAIKGGNKKNIKRSMDYIKDEEKTNTRDNRMSVLAYMDNDHKTAEGQFVSGYLCNPETAIEEFKIVQERNLAKKGLTVEDDDNIAYHIIQSFAEGTNIDPALVHQCGLELCQKIGYYQAVVCTHLNTDNYHNHIIINAHCMEPEKQFGKSKKRQKFKYHDCNETYALLRQYNDEIAMEHGLIIEHGDPEANINYSWYEQNAKNEGKSWKNDIRSDIIRISGDKNTWEEYKKAMEKEGYSLAENGKSISYRRLSDGKCIKDITLGKEFCKAALEAKWQFTGELEEKYDKDIYNSIVIKDDLIKKEDQNGLFVKLPDKSGYIRVPKGHYKKRDGIGYDALLPNLGMIQKYDDKEHMTVESPAMAIASLFIDANDLSKGITLEDLEKNNLQASYYYRKNWRNKYNKTYRVSIWTPDGYRKNAIELIFELAYAIIKHENNNVENSINPYMASTDWKLQRMVDSMQLAKEKNICSLSELDSKLDNTGKRLAQSKYQLKKTEAALQKMNHIYEVLTENQAYKAEYDRIQALPEEEKAAAIAENKEQIDLYLKRQEMLTRYKIDTDIAIDEFKRRYKSVNEHIGEIANAVNECKSEYFDLMTIKKSLDYCNDKDYVYGTGNGAKEISNAQYKISFPASSLKGEYGESCKVLVPNSYGEAYIFLDKTSLYKDGKSSYIAILDNQEELKACNSKDEALPSVNRDDVIKQFDKQLSQEQSIEKEIKDINKNKRKDLSR